MEQTTQSKNPNEITIDVHINQTDLDEVCAKCERLVSILETAERLFKELGIKKDISLTLDFEG